MVWSLYFVQDQDQGINITNDRLCQDNKSTILLKNHGKMLSHKRAKLIKANYFLSLTRSIKGTLLSNISLLSKCRFRSILCQIHDKPSELANQKLWSVQLTSIWIIENVTDKSKISVSNWHLQTPQSLQDCVGDSPNIGRKNDLDNPSQGQPYVTKRARWDMWNQTPVVPCRMAMMWNNDPWSLVISLFNWNLHCLNH